MYICVCGHRGSYHDAHSFSCEHKDEKGRLDCPCNNFIDVNFMGGEFCAICSHSGASHIIEAISGKTKLGEDGQPVFSKGNPVMWGCMTCKSQKLHEVKFK